MPTKSKAVVAQVIGRLMTEPEFRTSFKKDPDRVLGRYGLSLEAGERDRLIELNARIGKLRARSDAALHCEVASSVGYA